MAIVAERSPVWVNIAYARSLKLLVQSELADLERRYSARKNLLDQPSSDEPSCTVFSCGRAKARALQTEEVERGRRKRQELYICVLTSFQVLGFVDVQY
jgi:hypothetical protein